MNKSGLDEFVDFVDQAKNEALKKELRAINNKEEFIKRSIELGCENGFIFTEEDMNKMLADLASNYITYPLDQTTESLIPMGQVFF